MAGQDALRCRGLWLVFLFCGLGAKHVTPNFEVEAPTTAIAEKVALTAERCREELALAWLGHKLPNWYKPCRVRVKVGQIGAGGATTFSFGGGEVFGWDMTVQGPLERILDSVIPHEVSHTIFACHFRRPLPRWADEGAATLAEEDSERSRQQKLAEEVMPSKRRIPLRELLTITEYPKNLQHVLTLYAEGFSLANFLVQKGGKSRFLAFIQDAHVSGWDAALRRHYEEPSVESLESKWSQWVIAGSPALRPSEGQLLADANAASIIRSQNPDNSALASRSAASNADSSTNPRGRIVASASSGHSVAPRSETVEAPRPRSRPRPADAPDDAQVIVASAEDVRGELAPSPFQAASLTRDEDSPTAQTPGPNTPAAKLRLPRGPHLSRPELRRSPNPAATDRDDGHVPGANPAPSPFMPTETVESVRPRSSSSRVNPTVVQPAVMRR